MKPDLKLKAWFAAGGAVSPEVLGGGTGVPLAGGGIAKKIPKAASKASQKATSMARDMAKEAYVRPSQEKGVVYHGTNKDIKTFRKTLTPDDHVPGISVTDDPVSASIYAEDKANIRSAGEGANVLPLLVRTEKPMPYPELEAWALNKAKEKGFRIEDESDFAAFDVPPETLLQWLKEEGYDAIDYRDDPMLGYGLRVFEPNQLKSAIGNRTFDPQSPEIDKAEGGAVDNKLKEWFASTGGTAKRTEDIKSYQEGKIGADELVKYFPGLSAAMVEAQLTPQEEPRMAAGGNPELDPMMEAISHDRESKSDPRLEAAGVIGKSLIKSMASPFVGIYGTLKSGKYGTQEGIRAGEEAIEEFMHPGDISPEAMPYVQDVGKFLEELETKYKIPPLLPEAMPLTGIRGVKPQVQNIVSGVNERIKELPPIPVGLSTENVGPPLTEVVKPKKPEVVKAPANELGLYSPAEKAILNMQRKQGSGDAFLSELKKAGVSNDELEFTKLDDFLKSKKNFTRDELQEFIDKNKFEFEEIEYKQGRDADDASFYDPEVIDDPDYVNSRAEDMAIDFDEIYPGRRDEFREDILAKYDVTEEDLVNDPILAERINTEVNEAIFDTVYRDAQDEYNENPYMRWTNELGYEITGNDDFGYILYDPTGRQVRRNNRDQFRHFEDADGAAREDAYSDGLIGDETKFHDYQLDGGDNYREILLVSPQREKAHLTKREVDELLQIQSQYSGGKEMPPEVNQRYMNLRERFNSRGEQFNESHWDTEDVLLHMRVQDRTTTDGKPMLYVDEMQSDWHQKGNEQGYFDKESRAKRSEITAEESRLRDEFYAAQQKFDDYANQKRNEINLRITVETNRPPSMIEIKEVLDQDPTFNRLATDKNNARIALEDMRGKYLAFDDLIADAPYKDNWHELGVKRILAYAAKNGYDRVGFSAASPQIKRWGTQEIAWEKIPKGNMSKEGFLEWAHNKFATTPDEALNADWDNKGTLYKAYKELTDLPPAWRVAANEQRGGIAGRINLEAEARSRGILKTNRSDQVTSEAELRRIVDSSVRGLSEAQIDRITKKTWDRMQKQDAGVTAPREEGMKFFYDNKLKKFAEKYAKKMGGEFYEAETKTGRGVTEGGGYGDVTEPVYVIELTPKLKDSAIKGQAYKKGGLVTQPKGWKYKGSRPCKDFKAQKFARGGAVRMQIGGNPLDEIRKQLAAGVPVHMAPGEQGVMARELIAEENRKREEAERAREQRVANLPFMDKVRGGIEAGRTLQSVVGQEIAKPFVGLFGGEQKIKELEEGTPLPESEAGVQYLTNVAETLAPVGKVFEELKVPDVPFLPEVPVTFIPGLGRQVSGLAGKAAGKIDAAIPERLKNVPVGGSTMPAPGTPSVEQAIAGKIKVPADELGFYSATEKAAVNLQRKSGSGQAFLNDITKQPGVKKDELEAIGLADWLKSKPTVTKDEVVDYINDNKIQVKEVMKSKDLSESEILKMEELERLISKGYYDIPQEDLDWFEATKKRYMTNPPPKFDSEDLNLPGGKNYRELLLTFPIKKVEGDPYHMVRDEVLNPALKRVLGDTNAENALRRYQLLKNNPTWESDPDRLIAEDAIKKLEQAGEGDALNKYFASFDVNEQMRLAKESAYKSPHWEEPNVFAHIRMQDKNIDGKKTLVIEEIQSDWHQAGRDKGYAKAETKRIPGKAVPDEYGTYKVEWEDGTFSGGYSKESAEAKALEGKSDAKVGVPDAPFKEDWYQVALKRAMRYAADNDYDAVAIVGGKEQANRYALSRKVDAIGVEKTDGGRNINIQTKGRGTLELVVDNNGTVVSSSQKHFDRAVGKPITDVVGKSMGKKLMEMDKGVVSGQGLDIGGEGMAKYYDDIYPRYLEKQYKKYGVKPSKKDVQTKQYSESHIEEVQTGETDRFGRDVIGYKVIDPDSGDTVSFDYDIGRALDMANRDAPKTHVWTMDIPKELKADVKIGQSYKKGGLVKDKRLQEWHMAGGGVPKIAKAAAKAGKRMSREEAEKAGLWHDISDIKLRKPLSEVKAEVVKDPNAQMIERINITPEDLYGGISIPLFGDRSATGKVLKELEGVPMDVVLEGGGEFMLKHPGLLWASHPDRLEALAKKVRQASESGRPVYGVHSAMMPQSVDFSTMPVEAVLNALDVKSLRKQDIDAFDRAVRSIKGQGNKPKAPNFPGLRDPELREKLMNGPGGQRDAFLKAMDKKRFQEAGFPNVAEARYAVTEPLLLNVERGDSGFTIGEFDPEGVIETLSGHKSYPADIRGGYKGSFETLLPVENMYPTHYNARRLLGARPDQAIKSIESVLPLQYHDQEWLDQAMQYLEMQKRLTGRKKGGLASMNKSKE